MTPTLHVTNATSKRLHRGRVFNIMAAPRQWEHFAGNVAALTPAWKDVQAAKRALMSWGAYRMRYELKLNNALTIEPVTHLEPGRLRATSFNDESESIEVQDGDTLVCACAKAAADRGECHRVWAADFLKRAGWRVVLDGRELV